MAYNNLFPVTYPQFTQTPLPAQTPQIQQMMYPQPQIQQPYVGQQQVQQQNQESDINWVQGEAGARSWNVPAGKSVLLMDSETNTFYIKTVDASGMPQPLRVFDYKERVGNVQNKEAINTPQIDTSQFVTYDVLDRKLDDIISLIADDKPNHKGVINNG